jgi:Flp pilus assembly protein TadG
MAIKFPTKNPASSGWITRPHGSADCLRASRESGVTAIQFAVILVPVVFALIGFALDLGILYSVKGELKAAADSAALAAASQLIGTDAATAAATAAAQATYENTSGFGNRYYFHGLPVGQTSGTLISTVSDPAYFSTAAGAIASGTTSGGDSSGAQAKYVRATVTAQVPLLFWTFIPGVTDRNVTVLSTAVAGISAPLCEGCGIEPFAVPAFDQSDTTDFGFTLNTLYSFTYLCTGLPGPTVLAGASQQLNYLLLNRLDPNAAVYPSEDSQVFRDLAGGLPGNTNSAISCFTVNQPEVLWTDATVNPCGARRLAPLVTDALCGLDTRLDATTPTSCEGITGVDSLWPVYSPDPDTNSYTDYSDYTGNGRRIITIPVVDTLSPAGSMNVLGFRQFLASAAAVTDPFGRFIAMYIGSVAPIKQGSFQGCQLPAGPGKVVLHQ